MKAGTLLLIGAAGFAAYYYMNLGVAGATIQFVVQGIHFDGISTITINMYAQNVSNADLVVSSMSGNVTVNNIQMGNISDFTSRSIPANSQVIIPIVMRVSISSLPAVITAVLNSDAPVDVNISGNANVNGLVIPFSTDEQINAA